jgi:hypothetical protein
MTFRDFRPVTSGTPRLATTPRPDEFFYTLPMPPAQAKNQALYLERRFRLSPSHASIVAELAFVRETGR